MSIKSAGHLQRGVIVEFDFAVLPGHALLLEVCRERLATEGVVVDVPLMAHWMGGKSFSGGLHALCERQEKQIDFGVVMADCNAKFKEQLAENLEKVPATFLKVVEKLLKRGIKVSIVTRMEVERVAKVFEKIADKNLVIFHDISNGFGFHTRDAWQRAAHDMAIHERLCVAIAASGYSTRGALKVGMGIAAKVSAMTDHEDYSGTNIYFEEFEETLAGLIINYMRL